MVRQIFTSNKSLFFQIKRFLYDDLRYKKEFFVHRKTLINSLFIYNNQFFYILWRFFYIQKQKTPKEEDLSIGSVNQKNLINVDNIIPELGGNIYKSFLHDFLNVGKNNITKTPINFINVSNKIGNIFNEQNITELFYISPLNLDNKSTISQIQNLFMNDIDIMEQLYKSNVITNYNLLDIGIVSKFNAKVSTLDDPDEDQLIKFINKNASGILSLEDQLYKQLIWNILSNGIHQNKKYILNKLIQRSIG